MNETVSRVVIGHLGMIRCEYLALQSIAETIALILSTPTWKYARLQL